MVHGDNLDYLLLRHADGKHTPELDGVPELPDYLEPVLSAFAILSKQRQTGFSGPQPISVADALAYLEAIPIADPGYFLALLSSLDAVFLEWAREQIEARKTPNPPP